MLVLQYLEIQVFICPKYLIQASVLQTHMIKKLKICSDVVSLVGLVTQCVQLFSVLLTHVANSYMFF